MNTTLNYIVPYTANKCFNVSAFMKARKEAREKKIFEQRHLATELKRIERLQGKVEKAKERRRELLSEIDLNLICYHRGAINSTHPNSN